MGRVYSWVGNVQVSSMNFGFTLFGCSFFFESASVTKGNKFLDWIVDPNDILLWIGPSHMVLSREKGVQNELQEGGGESD